MQTEVTTWFLEMLDPGQLQFAAPSSEMLSQNTLRIEQAKIPSPELSRFLYTSVGGDWYWIERLTWSHDRWMQYLDRQQVETWIAHISGTPAGYIELEAQAAGNVEITYFGLLRHAMGKGLGKHLLSVGVQRAWEMGAQRVWVHTCSLDGPHALKNYQARGFQIYRQETHVEKLPDRPIGVWLGVTPSG
ncbi:MAG: GNAT family N-acetyltransferase [Cyanobacteria bacterium RM1_2_2]|nr:GNAT family N-acetyltransferase [Cyanobacteria bacterium RM1_2_2]